jgi:hypothetical protein
MAMLIFALFTWSSKILRLRLEPQPFVIHLSRLSKGSVVRWPMLFVLNVELRWSNKTKGRRGVGRPCLPALEETR